GEKANRQDAKAARRETLRMRQDARREASRRSTILHGKEKKVCSPGGLGVLAVFLSGSPLPRAPRRRAVSRERLDVLFQAVGRAHRRALDLAGEEEAERPLPQIDA